MNYFILTISPTFPADGFFPKFKAPIEYSTEADLKLLINKH